MDDDMTMSPDELDLLRAAVDYRLDHVWDALHKAIGRIEDDEAFNIYAEAMCKAYIHGYHDGDYRKIALHDDLDLDLRLADIWAEVNFEVLPEPLDRIFHNVIYPSYIAGWSDGAYDKPFGPAPRENPDGLNVAL